MDGGDDGFAEVDHVGDQVTRLAVNPHQRGVALDLLIDQLEAATGGEGAARTAHQHDARGGVVVNHLPDSGKCGVNIRVNRVEVGAVEDHFEHTVFVALKAHREIFVKISHVHAFRALVSGWVSG